MPFSSNSGILYPDDVAVLQRTFSRVCAERGIGSGGATAEHLAAKLVELRRNGIVDEAELMKALAS